MTMEETARPFYDTLAAVRRLTEAGLPEPHAEAVVREQVHVIEHNLATKADIEQLRLENKTEFESVLGEIEKLRLETKADTEKLRLETKTEFESVRGEIAKLRLETKADTEKLRLETKTEFESVRGEITKAKLDLIKWVFGANIALVAVVIAAVKLL